jgi:hypothetical protein
VRNEIFDNLHFTLKETDIYKVRLSIWLVEGMVTWYITIELM